MVSQQSESSLFLRLLENVRGEES